MMRLLPAALLLSVAVSLSHADVSGIILEDTVWTASNSPYLVVGDVVFAPGVTLTIEPGVTVEYAGAYEVLIVGVLIANGTETAPITFASLTPGISSNATMLKFEDTDLSLSQISQKYGQRRTDSSLW